MINSKNYRMYIFLFTMTILTAMGFQSWRTIFNNFAVEIVGVSGQEIGLIQGIREIPGFLALLVVYLLMIFKEHRLAALSILVFGVGISLVGILDSFWGLVTTTLILSFGFHYYETINQSLTLQYFDKVNTPLVIAKLRSFGALTNIITGGAIWLLASFLSYKSIFLLVGLVVIIGAIWLLNQNPAKKKMPAQHKKMIFRKKYWLFYVLTMLSGARRQIFVAFAVFLLVKKFNFSIQEITFLFILNNLINFFLTPYVGRAINKFGERKILSVEYTTLIFVFLVYAFTSSKLVAGCFYIIDNMVYGCAIAINSFFQKKAEVADIAPSMAVGFTINHIVAVILPIIGGLLWMKNYKIPFLIGIGLSIISLIFVQFIPKKKEAHN